MGFSSTDLTRSIGTEIRSDVETLLSGQHATEIRNLLERRGVLVFRELHLTRPQQMAFTRILGTPLPQNGKEVLNISLDKELNGAVADYRIGSFYWRVDLMATDMPTRASLLTARKLSDTGGDTYFANTYAAWNDLPDSEKKSLERLRVVHSFETTQRMFKPEPTYAELVEWPKKKSKVRPLSLDPQIGPQIHVAWRCRLNESVTQPQYIYRHKWKLGDLVIWDNTGTMHRVDPYLIGSGRLMPGTALAREERVA